MVFSRKYKRRFLGVVLVVVFVFIFACPTLIKPDTYFFPSLVKTSLVCSIAFIVNYRFLQRRFLFRGRYMSYVAGVLLLNVGVIALMMSLSGWSEYVPGHPHPSIPIQWMLPVVGMLFVSTLYGYFERERDSHNREIDLTHQNIEFEMKFLKSQINPHFLFNAMNNIYALSIIKSERTPDMILKLSDMLRYTLYDSENKKVKLKREIQYINNFIEFQKLKTDTELNINVDSSNCNDEFMIEPMLLIPFIENSFKHGNIDNPKKGWLYVDIKTLGPMLIFQVRNSLPVITINKDVVGGIGVENVRKRLDILYAGRYEMDVVTTDTEFGVYLKIDTIAS